MPSNILNALINNKKKRIVIKLLNMPRFISDVVNENLRTETTKFLSKYIYSNKTWFWIDLIVGFLMIIYGIKFIFF